MSLAVNGNIHFGHFQHLQEQPLPLPRKHQTLSVNEVDFAVDDLGMQSCNFADSLDWRLLHQQPKHIKVLVGHALLARREAVAGKRFTACVAAPVV